MYQLREHPLQAELIKAFHWAGESFALREAPRFIEQRPVSNVVIGVPETYYEGADDEPLYRMSVKLGTPVTANAWLQLFSALNEATGFDVNAADRAWPGALWTQTGVLQQLGLLVLGTPPDVWIEHGRFEFGKASFIFTSHSTHASVIVPVESRDPVHAAGTVLATLSSGTFSVEVKRAQLRFVTEIRKLPKDVEGRRLLPTSVMMGEFRVLDPETIQTLRLTGVFDFDLSLVFTVGALTVTIAAPLSIPDEAKSAALMPEQLPLRSAQHLFSVSAE